MAQTESFRTYVKSASRLTKAQHKAISRLEFSSLVIDYPDVDESLLLQYVERSEQMRSNPNRAVGGQTLRSNQAYARARSVMVADAAGELVAHVIAADNASKPAPESLPALPRPVMAIARTAIMKAKLHLPIGGLHGKPFVASRYLHYGYAPLAESARRGIREAGGDSLTVVDRLLYGGLTFGRKDMQPVSLYPYGEELDWKSGLNKAGIVPDEEYPREYIHPFGRERPVLQEHWTAPSVKSMTDWLLQKEGGKLAAESWQSK